MNDQTQEDPSETLSGVEKLVRDFESCKLPLEGFKHRAHLSVTLFYLTQMSLPDATVRMRRGLQRFIAHHGVEGYNETITLFWLKLVERFLKAHDSPPGRPAFRALLDELFENHGESGLIFDYYTRELLMSEKARASWVEPDLKPLDF